MTSIAHHHRAVPANASSAGALRLGSGLMALAGVAFVAYAVIFFVRNFTGSFLELGVGPAETGTTKDGIRAFSPDLYEYISHLHIAVSGFIAAAGVAVAALAWFGVRRGLLWAYVTAVVVPVLGLAVALPAHYPYDLDTLGHLGLIYLATVVFVIGAAIALKPLLATRGQPPTQ
ncbi:putative membrane protein [Streptomyces davaonensis JCM 4913]|uniref:Putative membrane protein n=1 Tax=Streptomyces davaonensis (strain DSM 101723 / JCM 4913 / KCC S-0913 / 768) TaxID=1214101 RepID=K4R6C9_STRDJ|nr:hypothetical protein [Streptomyces davaonensis]CCK28682.1 putative membrane protein [Streptomyces davaonensis JCM 4913]